MKVVHITSEFPPPILGGGGYHVYNLTKELCKRGVDVKVFAGDITSTKAPWKTHIEKVFGDVSVFRIPVINIPGRVYSLTPSLTTLLLREEAGLFHAHGYQFFPSDIAAVVSKLRHIPLILTLHGFPRGFYDFVHRLYRWSIGNYTLRNVTKFIAVSNQVARDFAAIGVPKNRIKVIPNGINLDDYTNMPGGKKFRERYGLEDKKIILAIGRLEKIKGFEYLIMALPKISEQISNVKIVIAGPEFNYGNELRRLSKEISVKKDVIFSGLMDKDDKKEALAAADVIVVPSIYEGFGIVLLEAMAAGKPVIATKTGAAPEIIEDGMTGLLVEIGNSEQLASLITKVLKNNRFAKELSVNAKIKVEKYDWKRITSEVLRLYEEVMKDFK